MSEEKELTVPPVPTQKTILTPNTTTLASPSGDKDDTTEIWFVYNIDYFWQPSVSLKSTTVVNDKDRGNSVVTFMQGLTIEYKDLGGRHYTVFLTGQIKDNGKIYDFRTRRLGTFLQYR